MKKLFIAIIILMICVSAIVLGTTRAFGVIDTEGYAIPADAGIVRALAGEGSAPIPLAQLHRDDEIYKAATGCYVGADRKKIDLAYPLYTNGGTGLRFFGEDNWLLTADVDLFKSYNGLYVSDGVSYNADMTQADDADYPAGDRQRPLHECSAGGIRKPSGAGRHPHQQHPLPAGGLDRMV